MPSSGSRNTVVFVRPKGTDKPPRQTSFFEWVGAIVVLIFMLCLAKSFLEIQQKKAARAAEIVETTPTWDK